MDYLPAEEETGQDERLPTPKSKFGVFFGREANLKLLFRRSFLRLGLRPK